VHLLYDLLLIGKVLTCAAAAADRIKYKSGIGRLIRTSFLFAGSIGSEFVIVSLGLTCMIDRCFDSRIMVVFIKGMECYKVDYNDNLERINARSSRSDHAMALVGAVDAT
jgi:hypothetical protein